MSSTEYLQKQISEQAERANDVNRESQKLETELKRVEKDTQQKASELQRIDGQNSAIKAKQYDREIEDLHRKLRDQERQREQFQNNIQNCHNQWSSKLQLFVTDMTHQSEKTQADIRQIHDLLESFKSVSEK